jgi:hypothetical protein
VFHVKRFGTIGGHENHPLAWRGGCLLGGIF